MKEETNAKLRRGIEFKLGIGNKKIRRSIYKSEISLQ